ncbi:hypothetical protein BXZ70DRAFT_1068434 [Cristinia sonorae]|uniref:Uncharacterized protein n=1 Tax=Cristinia sonorae TaxID=1940300 RepID=A0A8K0XK97_9AGAR|nr:hypothetical protein BXZ70DRAFT_1068434 [Cristinia sonorae]
MTNSNSIVLYFKPHEDPSLEMPFAVRSYYGKDVWEKRITAFTHKASRYYRKVFEWVWFLVFVAAMIGVPIAINRVAYNLLPEDEDDRKDKDDKDDHHFFHRPAFDRVWKARLIAFSAWFVITCLCYIPIIVWKMHGKKVVNKMLKKWEEEDRAMRPNTEVPTWKMRTPGFLSNNIKLTLYVPQIPPPSSFHPASTLPPYIVNGPNDPHAAYYYQPNMGMAPASAPSYSQYYNAPPVNGGGFPAAPLTSVSGLPLFNDKDVKERGYAPNADLEKQQFENIRV